MRILGLKDLTQYNFKAETLTLVDSLNKLSLYENSQMIFTIDQLNTLEKFKEIAFVTYKLNLLIIATLIGFSLSHKQKLTIYGDLSKLAELSKHINSAILRF